MMNWTKQGECTQRPGETLVGIEQEGFGIVCAVIDYEGDSVCRILRAVNAYDDLLEACKSALVGIGGDDASQAEAWEKVNAAINKAEA